MIVDDVPRGVDTAADLETARRLQVNPVLSENPTG
jgi:hypothetical protein